MSGTELSIIRGVTFPRAMLYDIVLQTAPVDSLLEAYNLSAEQFRELLKSQAFLDALREVRAEMAKEGFSFRMKAATMGESSLPVVFQIAHDATTPPAVRLAAAKSLVEWGGLEPAPGAQGPGQGVSITINLGQDDAKVIQS